MDNGAIAYKGYLHTEACTFIISTFSKAYNSVTVASKRLGLGNLVHIKSVCPLNRSRNGSPASQVLDIINAYEY